MADPIVAGDVKKDHLGVGAHNPGEVTAEDDIYEQYKKRMMLGYRHRPNPLVLQYIPFLFLLWFTIECLRPSYSFHILLLTHFLKLFFFLGVI